MPKILKKTTVTESEIDWADITDAQLEKEFQRRREAQRKAQVQKDLNDEYKEFKERRWDPFLGHCHADSNCRMRQFLEVRLSQTHISDTRKELTHCELETTGAALDAWREALKTQALGHRNFEDALNRIISSVTHAYFDLLRDDALFIACMCAQSIKLYKEKHSYGEKVEYLDKRIIKDMEEAAVERVAKFDKGRIALALKDVRDPGFWDPDVTRLARRFLTAAKKVAPEAPADLKKRQKPLSSDVVHALFDYSQHGRWDEIFAAVLGVVKLQNAVEDEEET